jgi:N-acetylglucosamine-6-phosphate deacetylase
MLDVDLTAVQMASANTARVLGLDRQKGVIADGYDADLILLDKELHVRETWVRGKNRWSVRRA